MTKQEIQALIDAKIAGQGSAVDVGGALPKILSEILNAAFAGANVQSDWNESDNTDPSFIKNKPTIAEPMFFSGTYDSSTGKYAVPGPSAINNIQSAIRAGKAVYFVNGANKNNMQLVVSANGGGAFVLLNDVTGEAYRIAD